MHFVGLFFVFITENARSKKTKFCGSLSSTSFVDWEAMRWKNKLMYYIATFFKLLYILYKVKKHENLYIQYWLNLRQVEEKKTHYVQLQHTEKGRGGRTWNSSSGNSLFDIHEEYQEWSSSLSSFSPTPSTCFLLCPRIPSALYSWHLQSIFFPRVMRQIWRPYKQISKIMV